jgi:hypothetical protein
MDMDVLVKGLQMAIRPEGVWCEYCQTDNCRHMQYVNHNKRNNVKIGERDGNYKTARN